MPSPIIASHRLECTVLGGTRPHRIRWFVDAFASGDTDGFDFNKHGGGSVGMSAAITAALPFLYPQFVSAMTVANFVLFEHLLGAFVPVGYDTSSHAGTFGSPFLVAQQTTLVFRGTSPRELIKHVLLESSGNYVGRTALPAGLTTPTQNYVLDLLDLSAGHLGSWVRSRSGNFASQFLAGTYCANKRLRRDAGLE
jgi:hypothetical protein